MSTTEGPQDRGPYPPPGSYGQYQPPNQPPMGYEQSPARPRNGFGIAALLLGLLALVLSWTIIGGLILGLLALIFGLLGRSRAKRGEATNGGLSIAGAVLGLVGLLIAIGLIALTVSIFNSPAGREYQQCIQQSGRDPARFQQCVSDFAREVESG